MVKVVEVSTVSPPPGSVGATSLPLTFLDVMFWIDSQHNQRTKRRIYFYRFPHSTSHFMQTALPNLKTSLSFTLQHFFPFAGNLRLPPLPHPPHIHYSDGDSLPFVVAESEAADSEEFRDDLITGINVRPRDGQELEDLVPKLPPLSTVSDGNDNVYEQEQQQQPVMAVQVTVFPEAEFSIGITFCHAAADGRAFSHFTKSWAYICNNINNKSIGNITISPPNYSRELVQDHGGIWSNIFLNESTISNNINPIITDINNNNVRITTLISQSHVELLKKGIGRKCTDDQPSLRLSTFVVTSAFVWVCLIKLKLQISSSGDDEDGICLFGFQADCRDSFGLPPTYFGNCQKPCIATAKRSELLGENGIVVAAKAIGAEIVEVEKEPLKGAENWVSSLMALMNKCQHVVALVGSPKLKVYETDFGWGRPTKTEVVHDVVSQGCISISIAESRIEKGGVEFGLSLSPDESDQFNAIFDQGLVELCW